ncbi:polysaccharide deacetylase [Clostridium sp. chh4-2]|uniref:polysaccharide deacetylase family protein n=1 Tax=Clostridium sp. chh4-2 TaxID=2067550 RepID=UPI000CCF9334|nr:polysaccharide deacetylase family protein [Clostridium sp. chh4-2]PNV63120.1 polysaccharide deacetylase [Clostridium sp. chh4-2]
MGKMDYRKRRLKRGRRKILNNLPIILTIIALLVILVTGGFMIKKQFFNNSKTAATSEASDPAQTEITPSSEEIIDIGDSELELLIQQADLMAQGYDYDGAIALLQSNEAYSSDPQVTEAISKYEEIKNTLVKVDNSKITHIFFHSLIMDTSKAFDGDSKEKGYNQMMTTKDEFLKILQSMYDRGFVLIRIHDIAEEVIGEDGVPRFVKKDIMLPEGKQPFVMSQDDVCYYEYMEGDGFASKMIIGEDGKPTTEMKMDDGTMSVGSYDLVPLLEDFIQEHPDFSYKGARAIIAFTGYNGILGYRTAASYSENPTYDQDREEAAKVAQCLRDNGWELASHSWGHRNMGAIKYEDFKTDTDKWKAEVESLIGPTDIILFPFGSDIGDWHPYTNDNSRFEYLKSAGFRYFCNVDSHQYWIQFGEDHLRQGRRNVDGYRMYYDLPETNPSNPKLSDLIDVEKVFDPARPKPVAPMGNGNTP